MPSPAACTSEEKSLTSSKPERTKRKRPRELIPGLARYGHPAVISSGDRESERDWRDSQLILELRGYRLRSRYSAHRTPSWSQRGTAILDTDEDALKSRFHPHQLDAIRIADGSRVFLKRVKENCEEVRIVHLFRKAKMHDLSNHCVPALDVFTDPQDRRFTYIVMPLLRNFDDPAFECIADVFDFVDQVLEGLAYLHELGIAHGRLTYRHILMDASGLYPRGYHPVLDNYLPDLTAYANPVSRTKAPVRYYFIDFSNACLMCPGMTTTHAQCASAESHETSDVGHSDPLKDDMFRLGNVLSKHVYLVYSNVEFLRPLVASLTQRNPDSIPQAPKALSHWQVVCESLPCRGRRLRRRTESFTEVVVHDIIAGSRLAFVESLHFILRAARFLGRQICFVLFVY